MSSALDPRSLSLEYLEAVGAKRFARVAELLHPDLEFRMAGKVISGSGDYLAALHRLAPILVRNEVKESVADGNEICVVYDFVTDTPVGPVPSAEWITLDGGRIRSIRLVFQRTRWPEVLAELSRRVPVGA